MGYLRAVLGPSWSILGPSWAILGVSWPILGHLGTKSFQDSPRLNLPVPRLRHLGPFWAPFLGQKLAIFWLFSRSFFGPVFRHFLEHFWTNFGDPFWDQMGLRGAKMGSKRPLKSLKVAKTCICKNIKKNIQFLSFQGRPRQPLEAQEGPQEAPKALQRL